MALRMSDKFYILCQWGQGHIHIAGTSSDRDAAFRICANLRNNHNKKHKRGNVPTYYVVERIASYACFPAPNKPKKIPNKSIPKGVISEAIKKDFMKGTE